MLEYSIPATYARIIAMGTANDIRMSNCRFTHSMLYCNFAKPPWTLHTLYLHQKPPIKQLEMLELKLILFTMMLIGQLTKSTYS